MGTEPSVDALWAQYLQVRFRFPRRRATKQLRNKIIEYYHPLTQRCLRAIRKRFRVRWTNEEIVSAMTYGLFYAVRGFDPSSGKEFEPLAMYWMRRSFVTELQRSRGMGYPMRRRLREFERNVQLLCSRLGRQAYDFEIAQALNLSFERIDALRLRNQQATIHQLAQLEERDVRNQLEQLAARNGGGGIDHLLVDDAVMAILCQAPVLTEEDLALLRLRYYQELPWNQVAHALGVVEITAHRRDGKLLKQLRQTSAASQLARGLSRTIRPLSKQRLLALLEKTPELNLLERQLFYLYYVEGLTNGSCRELLSVGKKKFHSILSGMGRKIRDHLPCDHQALVMHKRLTSRDT